MCIRNLESMIDFCFWNFLWVSACVSFQSNFIVFYLQHNELREYRIMNVLEFTSNRKRMGIIVKCPTNEDPDSPGPATAGGRLKLLIKGAVSLNCFYFCSHYVTDFITYTGFCDTRTPCRGSIRYDSSHYFPFEWICWSRLSNFMLRGSGHWRKLLQGLC